MSDWRTAFDVNAKLRARSRLRFASTHGGQLQMPYGCAERRRRCAAPVA